MKISNLKFKKGFTVLESIVAIAILSLSISGAFSAVRQSLSQSIISKDEVSAYYLAQEAVEIIRNRRDVNLLAKIDGDTVSWLNGIAENATDPCFVGKICKADATGPGGIYLFECAGGVCGNLRQDPANFIYSYDAGGDDTGFNREIQIEPINATEVAITVKVSWSRGALSRSFEAKTFLFDWI